MDLVAFHYDRSFVLDALRQGEIDCLEHVSEAAEADLFRHLIRRQIHPTPGRSLPIVAGEQRGLVQDIVILRPGPTPIAAHMAGANRVE